MTWENQAFERGLAKYHYSSSGTLKSRSQAWPLMLGSSNFAEWKMLNISRFISSEACHLHVA